MGSVSTAVTAGGRRGSRDVPDECRNRLEGVLVELGVARVLADLANDADEVLEDAGVDGRERLAGRQDDAHDASHQVVVLGHLLGRFAGLDPAKEGGQDVLRERPDVGLRELGLAVDSDKEDALDRRGRVG
jgi:hypothetical protein